jgi:hypothetical protein
MNIPLRDGKTIYFPQDWLFDQVTAWMSGQGFKGVRDYWLFFNSEAGDRWLGWRANLINPTEI